MSPSFERDQLTAFFFLRARPDEARAHFVLGMASFNLGDAENARTHLTRFVELAPDDPDAAIAHELLQYSN